MLIAKNLSYSYPGGSALNFPDFSCAARETRLLLGASGSGKTTMLQLLAGLRKPTTGTVTVAGTDLSSLSTAELDKFRGANIGMVFQTPHFVRSISIENNLRLAQQLGGKAIDGRHVAAVLTHLGLGDKLNSLPTKLSVGQQQRVAIARAIINGPRVILADEPTSALDDDNARRVLGLLRENAERVGASLLIVTHDNRLTAVVPNQTVL